MCAANQTQVIRPQEQRVLLTAEPSPSPSFCMQCESRFTVLLTREQYLLMYMDAACLCYVAISSTVCLKGFFLAFNHTLVGRGRMNLFLVNAAFFHLLRA